MRIKYIFQNIKLNTKSYIAIFGVVSLTLFMLLCSFGIRENVLAAQEENLSKYAVVVITSKSDNPTKIYSFDENGKITVLRDRILIDNVFMEQFAFEEYVVDYYGFVELGIRPKNFKSFDGIAVSVTRYSDISKSVLFTSGDRIMAEGHFAVNEFEVNISEELAALNGLSIGSLIEMIQWGVENEIYQCTVVGIFSDSRLGHPKELDWVEPFLNDDGVTYTDVGFNNLGANNILLFANTDTFYNNKEFGGYNYGYDAAVYYLKNEKDMAAFKDAVSKTLPEQFVMLDSMDMAVYIRHVLDKTVGSFTWLLIIMAVISVVFCTLLYIHVLKSRTYDISVLRARGMPRIKTAYSLTCEMFIVFFLSFAAASVLYFTSFTTVSNFMYALQDQFVSNDKSFYYGFSGPIINAAREYEFTATVYPITLIYGFIAVIAFTVIVGFAASLFISRHEPMKTMTKV